MIGVYDLIQTDHTLWRNFPLAGHGRWLMEELRPFLRAYIVESETEGKPFNLETRSMVYRRAKNVSSTEPFGTQLDLEKVGYEWLAHSVAAREPVDDPRKAFRVMVGGDACTKPYSASVFNISAMSFGSLGGKAIEALNRGAQMGGFYHDTGEGAVSRYHRAGGGDLVWEIGSGYFGCRNKDGSFDVEKFADTASGEQIKMIEIKLSQGAKPGHGGVLPGEKVTEEIAEARGIPLGETCYSPPSHSAFSTPQGLMEYIATLRERSGGKPVGFKLCIGNPRDAAAIVKAMIETGIYPDFIVVDGAEGGTGAAPAEFQDHIGMPLREGLVLMRNLLVGGGIRDRVRLAAAGKQVTAFQIASTMALGADWVNSARGFMFALGCIQSLHCHENTCPTGIATQDPGRQRGLVIPDKAMRVCMFHQNTLKALAEVISATGVTCPAELRPSHLMMRTGIHEIGSGNANYPLLEPGVLLSAPEETYLGRSWLDARTETFQP